MRGEKKREKKKKSPVPTFWKTIEILHKAEKRKLDKKVLCVWKLRGG